MHMHLGMKGLVNSPDTNPKITWQLLKRVLHYAKPYRGLMITMLLLILAQTGLMLLTPLILRDLIDKTIPAGDIHRLILLALALLLIPALNGAINVTQRRINVARGRGRDLRFAHSLVFQFAAYVAALFHQHQGRRVDEPPEQRCGRGANSHQQHHWWASSPRSSRLWRY